MTMKTEYKTAQTVDDLVISCDQDQAFVFHKELPTGGAFCLKASDLDLLTEQQILEKFNANIKRILDGIVNDCPVEIADGQPQLRWNHTCRKWSAVGHVLRCVVAWDRVDGDGEPTGQLAIRIDDKLLSQEEFLAVIETFEGWAMRIEFMHPNRLTDPPKPLVKTDGPIKTRKQE